MISTYQDDWLKETFEHQTRWIVELSDGTEVIQDDGRPSEAEPAWLRLGEYCRDNNLFIKSMRLQFRSHIEHIGSDADGFFFSKSIGGGFGGKNFHAYLTGTLRDGILKVVKWSVPELLRVPFIDDRMEQTRSIEEAGVCLIQK